MNIHLRMEPAASHVPSALQFGLNNDDEHHAQNTALAADSGKRLVIHVASDAEAGAARHSEVNHLLIGVMGTLAKCATAQLEREVEFIFDRICQWPEIERAGLWCRFSQHGKPVTLAHRYPRSENLPNDHPGEIDPEATDSASRVSWTIPLDKCSDPMRRFPWIDSQLQAGRTVAFAGLAELPPEAEQDKQALGEIGLRSAVVIPFHVEGVVTGTISFAAAGEEPTWPLEEVENLKLVTACSRLYGIAQKLQEEALTGALTEVRQLKNALDAHAIVAITDAHGKIWYVNDNFCAYSKFPREDVLGKTYAMLSSGYHSREFFEELWATIIRGEVWRGEIRNRAKDGSFLVDGDNDRAAPRRPRKTSRVYQHWFQHHGTEID